ncbi:MAG: MFS transporter [Candidatus Hydrogenedentes bacterium]|nr:MFS transporter [Candidatus Hydrogenedentota bacterium]
MCVNAASSSRVFWLSCGATSCVAIATNLPPVFLTTFSESLGGAAGLTEEQLGRISAMVFSGFVVGIAVASPLADRWGAKRFVFSGLISLIAGLGLLGFARSYAALLICVFLLGMGAGILEVVLSPIVAALQPHRRAATLNWLHSFYCVGAVGTVLIGSLALYAHVHWRAVALAILIVPAGALLGFTSVRVLALVHEDADYEPVHSLIRYPFFLAALALIFLGGATEIGMAQWLPAYAERGMGYSKATGGMALAAFSLAMWLGRILFGFLIRRIGVVSLMMICCVACIALILIGSFLPNAFTALSACIALGLTVSCFWPTTLGLASDRFPHGGAFMFGILAAFGNGGCILMPWLVGIIAERSELNWAIASITVCPLLMLAILVGMRAIPRERPD